MTAGERRWDGGESGERLAGAADHLERAYGRLLRWYPAGHQARHAEEMLGVLMASAGPGRRRPGLADSANLIGGALRIRFRAATTGSAGLWREALGRAGVLLPLAWVAMMVTLDGPGVARELGVNASVLTNLAQAYLPPLAVLITVLLGWRRLALAAIAAAVIIGPLDDLHYLGAPPPDAAAALAVLGIAAVALLAGPGRNRTRLTWRPYVLAVAAGAAAGSAERRLNYASDPLSLVRHAGWPAPEVAGLAVVAAVTVILLASSAVSRRLLILAAVPVYFYVVTLVLTPATWLYAPLLDLPLVALAGVAVLLAVQWARARRRRATAGG